jgi:hypothetical protein
MLELDAFVLIDEMRTQRSKLLGDYNLEYYLIMKKIKTYGFNIVKNFVIYLLLG